METKTNIQTAERLLLPARAVAELLGISTRQVWSLNATAQLPKPVRIRRSVRWRAVDIAEWITMDCPSRDGFEAATASDDSLMVLIDPS